MTVALDAGLALSVALDLVATLAFVSLAFEAGAFEDAATLDLGLAIVFLPRTDCR